MKKIILAVLALFAVSTSVFAAGEFVQFGVGETRAVGVKGNPHSTDGTVTVGKEFGPFTLDVQYGASRTNTNVDVDALAVRGRYDAQYGAVNPWVRVAVGNQFGDLPSKTFATIEPGISYKVSGNLIANASMLHSSVGQRNEYNLGATYLFDKKNRLELKATRINDRVDANALSLEYTRKF